MYINYIKISSVTTYLISECLNIEQTWNLELIDINNLKVYMFYLNICIQHEACCYSVTQSCLSLCDPMDYSTPIFPVLHQD